MDVEDLKMEKPLNAELHYAYYKVDVTKLNYCLTEVILPCLDRQTKQNTTQRRLLVLQILKGKGVVMDLLSFAFWCLIPVLI